jgi:hypothetical protein
MLRVNGAGAKLAPSHIYNRPRRFSIAFRMLPLDQNPLKMVSCKGRNCSLFRNFARVVTSIRAERDHVFPMPRDAEKAICPVRAPFGCANMTKASFEAFGAPVYSSVVPKDMTTRRLEDFADRAAIENGEVP